MESFKTLIRRHPDLTVFLISRWDAYLDGNNTGDAVLLRQNGITLDIEKTRDLFSKRLRETLLFLNQHAQQVVIMRQVPHQNVRPQEIYQKHNGFFGFSSESDGHINAALLAASISKTSHLKRQELANHTINNASAGLHRLKIIDPTTTLCADVCRLGSVTASFYHDDDHLSSVGFGLLGQKLEPFLTDKQNDDPERN